MRALGIWKKIIEIREWNIASDGQFLYHASNKVNKEGKSTISMTKLD
jgi:hypothetical protein